MARFFRCRHHLLAASVLLIFCAACAGNQPKNEEGGNSSSLFKKALQKTVGVTTYVVSAREAPLVITADGKTEISDRFEAKAPGPVKVDKYFADEGARVLPGDPLVKFDDETIALKLAVAQAEVHEAESGLAVYGNGSSATPREENTTTGNEGEETISEPTNVNPANASENLSESRANLYQAELDRAKAQVDLYEKITDLQELNSPIAGIVGPHLLSEGSRASQDQVLVRVSKLDPIHFTFKIRSEDLSYLMQKGSEIVVKLIAFPGQEFPAEVESIGSEASVSHGGVPVKLKIENPDLSIKGDLKGTVEIGTTAQRKVVSLPESAIVKTEHSAYVYKLDGDKARRIAVDLGAQSGDYVEIEQGVSDGDTIIISAENGMKELRDGSPVEVEATRAER